MGSSPICRTKRLKNGSITGCWSRFIFNIKKKIWEYKLLKQLQRQQNFLKYLRKQKTELLNFLEILKELTKNERTDRQTIEIQGVLADVALCSMNMERDAVQEMYGAGKISYGTSVSMKK